MSDLMITDPRLISAMQELGRGMKSPGDLAREPGTPKNNGGSLAERGNGARLGYNSGNAAMASSSRCLWQKINRA